MCVYMAIRNNEEIINYIDVNYCSIVTFSGVFSRIYLIIVDNRYLFKRKIIN